MDITYRPIGRGDRKPVSRLAGRAFGPAARLMVSLEEAGHVAELDGEIVGATVLKSFAAGGVRYGLTSWVMVDPTVRGRGIASRLIELAHEWFTEVEVDAGLAMIEGYNQSSSKIFRGRGYRRLPFGEQLRLFGVSIFSVWLRSYLAIGVGHFLWYRGPGGEPEGASGNSVVRGWVGALLFNAALVWILTLRWGIRAPALQTLVTAAAVPLALLGARSVLFVLAARAVGLRTRYRPWEGGAFLALIVAAAFGGYIPLPGSHYPDRESYRYAELLPKLGLASFLAFLGPLLALAAAQIAIARLNPVGLTDLALTVFVPVAALHVVVDLVPTFPFWGTTGRQVWTWSRPAWAVLAAGSGGALALGFVL